jgi:hypothetical protein
MLEERIDARQLTQELAETHEDNFWLEKVA